MGGAPARGRLEWQAAVIAGIETRTPRVTSFFFRISLADHLAGQHVDVRLTAADGYRAQRSYSIASAPGAPLLELAIERLDGGEVSPWFHEVAGIGDTIEMRGPIGGHFNWRAEDGGPLLLIAGGSGIVPLMAILRCRAGLTAPPPTLLLCSARSWDEAVFRDELLALEAAPQGPEIRFVTTRGPKQRPRDLDRRLDAASIAAALSHWGEAARHVYVCGANRFVESVTQALLAQAVPSDRIRVERFGGA